MPETRDQAPAEPNTTRSRPDLDGPVDEALRSVREVREENERRAASHGRTVIRGEVFARTTSGTDKERGVELTTADGRLYLNTHGEAVLDQDGVIDLSRKIAAALQAVS